MDILRLFFAFSSFVCQLCDCMLLDNFHSLSTWKTHFLSHPHTFARLICLLSRSSWMFENQLRKKTFCLQWNENSHVLFDWGAEKMCKFFHYSGKISSESREREANFPLTDALFHKRINSFPLALSLSHFPLKFRRKNSLCCRIKLIFTSPRSMWCWPERVRRRKDSTFQG